MQFKKSILVFVSLLVGVECFSQNPIPMGPFIGQQPKRSAINQILSKFKLGIGTGYGRTYYSHKLEGVNIIAKSRDTLYFFDPVLNIANDTISTVYANWFNNPQGFTMYIVGQDTISRNGIPVSPNDFLLGTDTTKVRFRSAAPSVPLDFTLELNILRYRVGIGYEFEFQKFNRFTSKHLPDSIGFTPSFKRATFKRLYFILGAQFYKSGHFSAYADAKVGTMKFGKNFNNSVIQRGIFVNFGATAELQFSEYLTAFFRPSFDIKTYTVNVPETTFKVDHFYPAWFLQFGVKLSVPSLKKCPYPDCKTQINHVHWGTEYRSRVHPFWKWQNPHYGENYKKLIKYKGRNKRKKNPY